MGAQLPVSDPQTKDNELDVASRICSGMALSSDLNTRLQALEVHEMISECWHYLKGVCGLRWMLAGIPAEIAHDVRQVERYVLSHHRDLLALNPHVLVLRRLSDQIRLASRRANDLARVRRRA